MVERHFYMVNTGVQFSNEVPEIKEAWLSGRRQLLAKESGV